MQPFDLLDPLPAAGSTVVLEASAGTGKTYTLAGLVTRYVAEGEARLDEMLLITFGRAASQELRERVREQLVLAERELAARLAAPAHVLATVLLSHPSKVEHPPGVAPPRRLRPAWGTGIAARGDRGG